jgi:hypothetical protein
VTRPNFILSTPDQEIASVVLPSSFGPLPNSYARLQVPLCSSVHGLCVLNSVALANLKLFVAGRSAVFGPTNCPLSRSRSVRSIEISDRQFENQIFEAEVS